MPSTQRAAIHTHCKRRRAVFFFFILARPTGRIKIVKLSSTLTALHRQIEYIIIIVLSGAAPEFL